jgi:hypothetical protein
MWMSDDARIIRDLTRTTKSTGIIELKRFPIAMDVKFFTIIEILGAENLSQ